MTHYFISSWLQKVPKNAYMQLLKSSLNKPSIYKSYVFTDKLVVHLTTRRVASIDSCCHPTRKSKLTFPVQIPHPAQANIKFPTPSRHKIINNNNNNNNNFIYIALKSNNCPKRYLITKWNIKNLNYKISTIYNII